MATRALVGTITGGGIATGLDLDVQGAVTGNSVSADDFIGGDASFDTLVTAVPKVYRALISQGGTFAPTTTVLENTLGGTVVWTRSSGGDFLGTLTGAFLVSKVFFNISNGSDGLASFFNLSRASNNTIRLETFDTAGSYSDDRLSLVSLEIIVYP